MRLAVIGANGFIGRSLCSALKRAGHNVLALVRCIETEDLQCSSVIFINDAGPQERWHELIHGIDVVIYLASPKAVDKPNSLQIKDYDRIIVGGATAVAEACVAKNVKRMIFLSSIKVNGETSDERVFTVHSKPNPTTKYARAKLDAEHQLLALSEKGLRITIIRPPAVYGAQGKGNINFLINLLANFPCWAIPLSDVKNERAMIFIDNLVSAVIRSVEDRGETSRLFLVRDPQMLSTTQLCQILLREMNRPEKLSGDPYSIFEASAKSLFPRLASRLYSSLRIDDSRIKTSLGWKAPFSAHEGLALSVPKAAIGDKLTL